MSPPAAAPAPCRSAHAQRAGRSSQAGKELEVQPGTFVDQYTFASQVSSSSTCSTVGEVSSSEFLSRQCTEIDALAQVAWSESALEDAVRAATAECRFSVTVADPRRADFPLIAVSQAFEAMTGFKREEILGKNCRFLNYGCDLEPAKQQALREASSTGAPFTALLLNRRKSGDLFLNLLDLRGLVVANNPGTGEELWFLVGIQADISGLAEEDYPEDHLAELGQVAAAIRTRITAGLTSFAVAGALAAEAQTPTMSPAKANAWYPLREPQWRNCHGSAALLQQLGEAGLKREAAEKQQEEGARGQAGAELGPAPWREKATSWPVESPQVVSGLVLGMAAASAISIIAFGRRKSF